jgi:hypothetical protein
LIKAYLFAIMKLFFNVLLLCFGLFFLLPCIVVSCTSSAGDDAVLVDDNYDDYPNDTLVSDFDSTHCFLHPKASIAVKGGHKHLKSVKVPTNTYSQTATSEAGFLIHLIGWVRLWGGQLLWALIPLLEVVVRLTPTERDNSIFNFLKRLLDTLIPNRSLAEDTEHV